MGILGSFDKHYANKLHLNKSKAKELNFFLTVSSRLYEVWLPGFFAFITFNSKSSPTNCISKEYFTIPIMCAHFQFEKFCL